MLKMVCACAMHLSKAAAMVTGHRSFNLELANYFFQHVCFAHPEEALELFSAGCVYDCVCVCVCVARQETDSVLIITLAEPIRCLLLFKINMCKQTGGCIHGQISTNIVFQMS